ncbi:MAG: RES family NAD+ phosphorylase [Gemmatimonadota bacterium]
MALWPPTCHVSGHRLALVRAEISEALGEDLADLCDPASLLELDVRPDETAAASRRTTQAIAEQVHAARFAGLRWWSAFRGEWHTLVLFPDRHGPRAVRFDVPEPLDLSHEAVRTAMRELGIGRA